MAKNYSKEKSKPIAVKTRVKSREEIKNKKKLLNTPVELFHTIAFLGCSLCSAALFSGPVSLPPSKNGFILILVSGYLSCVAAKDDKLLSTHLTGLLSLPVVYSFRPHAVKKSGHQRGGKKYLYFMTYWSVSRLFVMKIYIQF